MLNPITERTPTLLVKKTLRRFNSENASKSWIYSMKIYIKNAFFKKYIKIFLYVRDL